MGQLLTLAPQQSKARSCTFTSSAKGPRDDIWGLRARHAMKRPPTEAALLAVRATDGLRNHALSSAYFSWISRLYSACTAFREMCPFRSLAIFRRSGSVGACDFRLNLAKSLLAGPGVFPNRRSNHPIVSSLVRGHFLPQTRTPRPKYGQHRQAIRTTGNSRTLREPRIRTECPLRFKTGNALIETISAYKSPQRPDRRPPYRARHWRLREPQTFDPRPGENAKHFRWNNPALADRAYLLPDRSESAKRPVTSASRALRKSISRSIP